MRFESAYSLSTEVAAQLNVLFCNATYDTRDGSFRNQRDHQRSTAKKKTFPKMFFRYNAKCTVSVMLYEFDALPDY